MKSTLNTDWPIMGWNNATDERADRTFLIESGYESKTTASDEGEYWYIREWEEYQDNGITYWLERHGYSISKKVIKSLMEIS